MNILSGALIPLEVLPQAVREISRFIPMTYMVTLLRGLWFGDSWGNHLLEVAVLVGLLILGMIVVGLTFKWE
jgi:ABC-2 type transport system permease protein